MEHDRVRLLRYNLASEIRIMDTRANLFKHSGRLFANPSFIAGIAKSMDIGAVFDEYNTNITPNAADFYALLSDWYAVGDDVDFSISAYESEQASKK